MSDADKKAEALMQGLQREQCYLIMMRPAENPPEPPKPQAEMRLEHHDFLVEMERTGVLFAAGPCRDDEGWVRGTGLLIFRAASRAEATALAMQEPYTKYGQRDIDVIPWQRNEGNMQMTINLADGVLSIDKRTWKIGPPDA
ncbi:MAG: YciI family protein [Proteobacteria bacterium]|nr:YciI family protein [Pseudomonadota bacterium]